MRKDWTVTVVFHHCSSNKMKRVTIKFADLFLKTKNLNATLWARGDVTVKTQSIVLCAVPSPSVKNKNKGENWLDHLWRRGYEVGWRRLMPVWYIRPSVLLSNNIGNGSPPPSLPLFMLLIIYIVYKAFCFFVFFLFYHLIWNAHWGTWRAVAAVPSHPVTHSPLSRSHPTNKQLVIRKSHIFS